MAGDPGIYTRGLAEYIAASRNELLPDDLTEWIKLLTLDTIGCGLLASPFPWTQRLLDTVKATEAPGPARIWGTDQRFSPANAAMVNGTSVHGFELDDVGVGHNGSVTTTVALALADAGAPLSGKDLIRATVTGIEVSARVNASAGRIPHVKMGFHGPGLFGAFTAMATASYVLNLSAEQVVHAVGHVSQFTGGLMGTHHGGMGKRLLAGKAAHSGTLAAQLAQHGFTNVDNIMECGYGSFPSAFSGGNETYRLEELTRGLGEGDFRAYAVNFKMWAARIPIHPSMEAIKALRKERELRAEDIARVDVRLSEGSFKAVGFKYAPTTITSAQLNLQYCIAIMLLENDLFIGQFTEEKIKRQDVLDLVAKIHISHDPALDSTQHNEQPRLTHLEFTLNDGSVVRTQGDNRNRHNNPVTHAEVVEKFYKTTAERLTAEQQATVVDLCERLETLPDARVLLDALTG